MISTETTIRHPQPGEVPAELMTGFEAWKIDLEWQWVVVHNDRIVAQILCSNMHGMLYMLRLTSTRDAPFGWALKLFRQVLRDARDRGLIGYLVLLQDSTREMRRLMTIIQRHNGYLEPVTGVLAAGRLEVR
jgi:hypothetical protein